MNLEDFAVDPEQWENGKRIDFQAGAYIRVRSASSHIAQKARERLNKPYVNWTTDLPDEISDKINVYWVAQGLLSEFVGFKVDGEPVHVDLAKPEDRERLAKILLRPEFVAFNQRVRVLALNESTFKAEQDAALEKNSENLPDGGSGGEHSPNS